jgi:SAM-dependent methyltransferase
MNAQTINRLNEINRRFYATTATEFDQTRGKAWLGWAKLAEHLQAPLSVLDVGCGNGRFGLFLAESLPLTPQPPFPASEARGSEMRQEQASMIHYHGLDNNEALLAFAKEAFEGQANLKAKLETFDLVQQNLPDEVYDLVVLFGVIHHVPGAEQRRAFMAELAKRVKKGSILCFASWRFYEFERFRERISEWPADLEVEEHDYLLDWRRGENALRYCHYVDDAEEDALIAATGMSVLARYRADGENNRMNSYVVLRHQN